MKHKVIVIGSGFAGLSVATHLAHEGYDVTVFEKNESLGGRARKFSQDGFTFDMGPSWYWMPDVFEQYFEKFGKSVSDYYELERLDPSYRIYFSEDHIMDLPASMEGMYELFEKYEPGSSENLKKFLAEAEYKYEVGINDLVYKPGQSLLEFADMRVIKGAFRLQLLNSLSSHVRNYFKNPHLIELLEFPVLFLGAKPSKTPALYSLMNYADISLGTWYPKGGMHKIVEGMVALAEEKGVKFHVNAAVEQILTKDGKATGVKLHSGETHMSDTVISGADYNHTETMLLRPEERNYTESYWDKRIMAPSSMLYYVGLNKKIDGILHHNLFFDTDFNKHAQQIYDNPEWPDEPLFYVSATSVTDETVAPEGCENLFILIPTAPGLLEDQERKDHYFDLIMSRMESAFKQNIRDNVIFRRDFACTDFIKDYNSFKGNAYGLANTLNQTALLKPSLRNKRVRNLFYTGQLTVPGPGVPPSLISGAVVAKEVMKAG
jgi:phytoene desaturase